jgi:hypothetical protein
VTPGRAVTLVGCLTAVWCLGFAAANFLFEVTGHFARGALAAYAPGISVVDWFVFSLKLLGAAVALLTVMRLPSRVSPGAVAVLAWGATALLGLYSLGNVLETVGMATGLTGSADQITVRSLGYVLFFLLAATGFGTLTVSFSRRYDVGRRAMFLGMLGAPVLLGLILLALPRLLVATGVMPDLYRLGR